MSSYSFGLFWNLLHPWDKKNLIATLKVPIRVLFEDRFRLFEIVQRNKFQKMAEIGVRYGDVAYAFLSGNPEGVYYGYDIINGPHGGRPNGEDTFIYVQNIIKKNFPRAVTHFRHKNTQRIQRLSGCFDVVHVDGDHGFDECFHDIEISFRSIHDYGWIIVDDFDHIPNVRKAVMKFVEKNKKQIKNHWGEKSYRGRYFIVKAECVHKYL